MAATMKKVSSAKLSRNPSGLDSATDTARASQTASARPTRGQAILFFSEGRCLKWDAMSTTASAAIAIPYHVGKNPAPGPSSPIYSQREATTTM